MAAARDLLVRLPTHPQLLVSDHENAELLHFGFGHFAFVDGLEEVPVRANEVQARQEVVSRHLHHLELLQIFQRLRCNVVAVEEHALEVRPVVLP